MPANLREYQRPVPVIRDADPIFAIRDTMRLLPEPVMRFQDIASARSGSLALWRVTLLDSSVRKAKPPAFDEDGFIVNRSGKMTDRFLKTRFRNYLALYVCLNVAGCATPAAWKYAEQKANEPPTYWSITDVTFAALDGPDQLRLCVLARTGETEEASPATLTINLEEISNSLAERITTENNDTSPADNAVGEGSKLTNRCEPVTQGDEELVSIERVQVAAEDLSDALEQLAPEALTVFVLEQSGSSHTVVGSPDQDFPGLNREVFSAHVENNASKGGYVLVPLAVVADTVLVVAAGAVVIVGAAFYALFCLFSMGGCVAIN